MIFIRNFVLCCIVTLVVAPAMAAGTHPITGEALADEQSFVYRILGEPSSLDPQTVEDVAGSDIIRDLFEGLFNQDEEGNLVPGVATRFEANADKTVYTFHLRDNAKWSDGNPVTAHDFVYAWRRAADPETASPYAWFMELMAIDNVTDVIGGGKPPSDLGITALDDLTLEVRLNYSLPYFPLMTTHVTTFPSPKSAIDRHGAEWTNPDNIVSNGAYVLTQHVPQKGSVRLPNPQYWDSKNTIIQKVVALIVGDENDALTHYFAGNLDRTGIPFGQYPEMKEKHPDDAHVFPRLCSYWYTFNLSDLGPLAFKDIRVRKALSFALDRDFIVGEVLRSGQFPAYTFTPNATANFEGPNAEISNLTQAERDAIAKELMHDAGYGTGNPLKFTMLYNTSDGHKKIATAMAQMWNQKLGVEVTLANKDWKEFLDVRGAQNFEMARGAWCGDYNEASTFLDILSSRSGYNDGKFANTRVDQLLNSARTADDPSPYYTEIEEILAEEMPVIPVYHYSGVFLLNPRLKNWPFSNVEQLWYSKNFYKVAE
jgi:oligopeptide transport system substrate-binding protein